MPDATCIAMLGSVEKLPRPVFAQVTEPQIDAMIRAVAPEMAPGLRVAMLTNGVDIMGAPGGLASATHGAREVAQTLEAFRTGVRWLKAEGDV